MKHAGDLWYHFDENPGIEESPAGGTCAFYALGKLAGINDLAKLREVTPSVSYRGCLVIAT